MKHTYRNLLRGLSIAFLLAAGAVAWSDDSEQKFELTVIVKGRQPATGKAEGISRASVHVKQSEKSSERSTNGKGKATFTVGSGEVILFVTGENTDDNWGTGTCKKEIAGDAKIEFVLDNKDKTSDCRLLMQELADAQSAEKGAKEKSRKGKDKDRKKDTEPSE